ncbi:MAG: response regulator transcription factor [Lachnospiraceae bacterium]|nr:response regulator transcription factor [Lachnospiraceae bacterium]
MRLKIAVCAKEKLFCEEIQRKIWINRPECKVVLFQSGKELLTIEKNYDIVFLDTEISDRNGMEVARELRKDNYKGYIIFLTNHAEFMADAFKVKAFCFLDKTITTRQLHETILEIEAEMFQNRKMIITDNGMEKVVKLEEILYVEAINNKTVLHTVSEEIETGKPLKYWKEELGTEFFCQTHKSYILGLKHVKEIKNGEATLRSSNQKIPISRRNYANCKKALYTYIREYGRGI